MVHCITGTVYLLFFIKTHLKRFLQKDFKLWILEKMDKKKTKILIIFHYFFCFFKEMFKGSMRKNVKKF